MQSSFDVWLKNVEIDYFLFFFSTQYISMFPLTLEKIFD